MLFLDTPELKPAPEETFVWVVTKTDMRWVRSALDTPVLTSEVQALRCGLDGTAWDGPLCTEISGKSYIRAELNAGKPLPFDLPAPIGSTRRCSARWKTSSKARSFSSCRLARSRSCRFRCW